jgi:PPK2 family polyphosphate:nucleotide phosphotransferase
VSHDEDEPAKKRKIRWKRVAKLVGRYCVTEGKGFRLRDVDPGDTGGLEAETKPAAHELLALGIERLADAQDRLYAENRRALLLIFQAMDAAGKDSTIKHVMSGVNPMGCQVWAFKQPNDAELDHDFLWRCVLRLPERGRIGIFNRSYYEEVLVVRVHPEILKGQRLPPERVRPRIFDERLEDIANFERYLIRNGVAVLKFFLHVSPEEQKRRFLERLERPEKNWKFSMADVRDRDEWDEYMKAYERAIRATATPDAPWMVVPADHKWFTRLVVSAAIVGTLEGMDLRYPTVDPAMKKELAAARKRLLAAR